MLDDIQKDDVLVVLHALQQLKQKIPHNLMNVRWSTRLSRPPERFSPSLSSILLTDVGELEFYDEAM